MYQDGPSPGTKTRSIPEKERTAVAVSRAKYEAAKRVWEKRQSKTAVLRRMLAGRGHGTAPASKDRATTHEAYPLGPNPHETETNLFLRSQMKLKGEAADGDWTVRYPTSGDLPDEIVEEIESFHERLAVDADVAMEFSDAIDDGGTVGPMCIRFGIDRFAVNRVKMAGAATPIADLVLAAANGADVHPPPGMDFAALAKSARDFLADPQQSMLLTLEQIENLTRLAQEADEKWSEEMDKAPEGYDYGGLWSRRVVYGDDVFWDARVTTRWQDARDVFFRISMTPEQAQNEDSFKPSARKGLRGVPVSAEDGWVSMSSTALQQEQIESLNRVVSIIEHWCRDDGAVHYFTETSEYDGFLEKDARYPFFDSKGRSVLRNWFPMRACTPVVHNLRVPERTLGIPWLEPGLPHAIQYVLFDSALTASRKKAGSIIEYPDELPNEIKDALERGEDRVLVPRPAEVPDGKDLIVVHDFGQSPVDFVMAKQDALYAYARSVDMTVEEISGVSIAPTLGQAEKASEGAKTSRGGLIRKLEMFAGELVRDLGAIARHLYTDERVTQLMGAAFTERRPMMTPTGPPDPATGAPTPAPVMGPDGQPVRLPSVWDIFKASSLLGDRVEVVFAPSSHGQDLMRAKMEDDTLALMATPAGIDPTTGMPYWDPRPIWERTMKSRGMGRLKPFPVPPMLPAQAGPPGKEGEDDGGDDRSARGARGQTPVPGRQGRGEKPDVGDQSTKTHRVSTQ